MILLARLNEISPFEQGDWWLSYNDIVIWHRNPEWVNIKLEQPYTQPGQFATMSVIELTEKEFKEWMLERL